MPRTCSSAAAARRLWLANHSRTVSPPSAAVTAKPTARERSASGFAHGSPAEAARELAASQQASVAEFIADLGGDGRRRLARRPSRLLDQLAGMAVPLFVFVAPLYLLMRDLNLLGTTQGVILERGPLPVSVKPCGGGGRRRCRRPRKRWISGPGTGRVLGPDHPATTQIREALEVATVGGWNVAERRWDRPGGVVRFALLVAVGVFFAGQASRRKNRHRVWHSPRLLPGDLGCRVGATSKPSSPATPAALRVARRDQSLPKRAPTALPMFEHLADVQ